jgi:acetolactate synthase-1/3 small subunit
MQQTLIAYVQDEPMMLNRVVGLLRRRGFAVDGIAFGPAETMGVVRMTLVVDAASTEQVVKQLERLVPVIEVVAASADALERETALVRVDADADARAALVGLCMATAARVLAVGEQSMVVEITGAPSDVERFLTLIRPFGVRELARSGRIAMQRPQPINSSAQESPWPRSTTINKQIWTACAAAESPSSATAVRVTHTR